MWFKVSSSASGRHEGEVVGRMSAGTLQSIFLWVTKVKLGVYTNDSIVHAVFSMCSFLYLLCEEGMEKVRKTGNSSSILREKLCNLNHGGNLEVAKGFWIWQMLEDLN